MESFRFLVLDLYNQSLLMYRTMIIKAESQRRKATANTQWGSEKHSSKANVLYDQAHIECDEEKQNANAYPTCACTKCDCNRSEMKRVFDLFDENKDGLISPEELRQFMNKLGFELSDHYVKSMVGTVDSNNDNSIDFEEFYSLYNCLTKGGRETEDLKSDQQKTNSDHDDEEGTLLRAFFVFDENKDGMISATELQQVLLRLGLPEGKSLIGCQRMIERVDSDGNGKVDFFEFKNMMSSHDFSFCTA